MNLNLRERGNSSNGGGAAGVQQHEVKKDKIIQLIGIIANGSAMATADSLGVDGDANSQRSPS